MSSVVSAKALFIGALFTCLGIFTVSCNKKCQPPPEQPLKSITETEWRLVETTNSQLKTSLSKTSFPIFAFKPNNEGEIFDVQNNNRPDTADTLFDYLVNPEDGTLRISYRKTGTEPSEGTAIDYRYDLGRDLELTQTTGTYYRFVPFRGIINPDDTCDGF